MHIFFANLGLIPFLFAPVAAPSPESGSPNSSPQSEPSPIKKSSSPRKKRRKLLGKKARKAREKRKREAKLEKLRQDLFPQSILAQKAPRLDSVFLFWKLGNKRLRRLSPSTLLRVVSKEVDRFGKKTFGQCKKEAASLREALITVATDRDEVITLLEKSADSAPTLTSS